jgi:hypothetical protein
MITRKLRLGCTLARHKQIGIHAIINARAGRQDLNDLSHEDVELHRDARKLREHRESRVIIHQFNSRFLFRNRARVAHLLFKEDR